MRDAPIATAILRPEKNVLDHILHRTDIRTRTSQREVVIMANPFVHVELNATDVKAAKSFYGALFGWSLEDVPMGGGHVYTMIGVGEGTGGGMQTHPVPGAPSAWLPYVGVHHTHPPPPKPPTPAPPLTPHPLTVHR